MTLDDLFQIFATSRFGAYAVSSDQTIVFWNQSAERILGYSADEVLGRHCGEVDFDLDPLGFASEDQDVGALVTALTTGEVPEAPNLPVHDVSEPSELISQTPVLVWDVEGGTPLLLYLVDDGQGLESEYPVVIADPSGAGMLTPREVEVLHLVALGKDTLAIAAEIGVSEHTALNHIRNFRQKLDAQNKLQAVVTAVGLGILRWQ